MADADRLFADQLNVVVDHCVETGLKAGAGVVREAIAELSRLRTQLDHYERNIEAHRKLGEASSMACLYCKYEEGSLRKPCFPHFELTRLQERCDSLEEVVAATSQIPDHVWAYPQMDPLRAALDKAKGGE